MGTKRQPVLAHNQVLHSPPTFASDPSSLRGNPSCRFVPVAHLVCLKFLLSFEAKTLESKSIKTCYFHCQLFLIPGDQSPSISLDGGREEKKVGCPYQSITPMKTLTCLRRPGSSLVLPLILLVAWVNPFPL